MRTRFGLILKITVRTKSYAPPKSRYFTKQPDSQVKLSLFSGYLPSYSLDMSKKGTNIIKLEITGKLQGHTLQNPSPHAHPCAVMPSRLSTSAHLPTSSATASSLRPMVSNCLFPECCQKRSSGKSKGVWTWRESMLGAVGAH